MMQLKCTTSNCQHNLKCHCNAGVISITDKGKTAVTTTHEIFTAIDLGMFDGMSDEMLSTFVEALQVMQDNLRQIYSQLKGDKTT